MIILMNISHFSTVVGMVYKLIHNQIQAISNPVDVISLLNLHVMKNTHNNIILHNFEKSYLVLYNRYYHHIM